MRICIVEFWRAVPEAEREARFKSLSEELYEYLSERDDDDLDCLASSGCLNVPVLLAKRIKILPALSKYGVDNLRTEMNVSAREFLLHEMENRAVAFLPEIPVLVREKFESEIRLGLEKIAGVRNDYTHFLKEVAGGWARRHLQNNGGVLNGVEVSPIRVRLVPKRSLDLKAVLNPQRGFETGAATLGSSLSLAARRLEKIQNPELARRPETLRLGIAQINKLLAIGGFKTSADKGFPSYSVAMNSDAPTFTHLNLRNFLSESYSFAVPDRF